MLLEPLGDFLLLGELVLRIVSDFAWASRSEYTASPIPLTLMSWAMDLNGLALVSVAARILPMPRMASNSFVAPSFRRTSIFDF